MAIEVNSSSVFRTFQFPRIAIAKPVIRILNLSAVFDMLIEHAVFVSNTVSQNRQLQIGTAVQKTSCQSSQASIAQAGILLHLSSLFHADAKILQGLTDRIFQLQIQNRVC